MDIFNKRRSIRNFSSKMIEIDKIMDILLAGMSAPSPKNRQPWHFVVFTDKIEKNSMVQSMRTEILDLMREKPDRQDICESLETINIIEQAPVFILVTYDYGMVECHDDGVDWKISAKDIEAVELQSIGAAVENMLLKAEEIGLGGLWCADILYAYGTVSKYSENPIVSAVCLGYKKDIPNGKRKAAISEKCTFI